ncbi:GNAT family N-acetyltransferase [Candidatus Woesearchaeota archaeon]|nr:GNAT family N-acetyltransferase [Candidatus Woesearchaeota archaeon]
MVVRIRKYRKSDRNAVRKICCDTGFLGNPIDKIFQDRELWADALTSYYTDKEPDSIYVAEESGKVVGYIFGCRISWREEGYVKRNALKWIIRLFWRYTTNKYNRKTKDFVKYLLFHSKGQIPKVPRNYAHLHINVMEGKRYKGTGKRLMNIYFKYLKTYGVAGVYLQTFEFPGAPAYRFFKSFGFRVYDRVESHLWAKHFNKKIYLTTMIKSL